LVIFWICPSEAAHGNVASHQVAQIILTKNKFLNFNPILTGPGKVKFFNFIKMKQIK